MAAVVVRPVSFSVARSRSLSPSSSCRLLFGLVFAAALSRSGAAHAFPEKLDAWKARYGAGSASGDRAGCQLCHANGNGGSPWNAYGWDIRLALDDADCDLNGDGTVSDPEAFYCVELKDSDRDGTADNISEIGLGTQPGWSDGNTNTLYTNAGAIGARPAPATLASLDPEGGAQPAPAPPPPIEEHPGRMRAVQFVFPGRSIQRAIDRARPGGWIFVLPGTYREVGDETNGLKITTSGLHLVGLSTRTKRVVLENAGNQRNGIVAVPGDRTKCMGCHTELSPPFPLVDDPEITGVKSTAPKLHGLLISGITIKDFKNNGLFTENVERFAIVDVETVGNKNYGIFPTLSSNGIITHSRASGTNDSGIWIETSNNVRVTHNVVEDNVNGFEISNSSNITLAHNISRGNAVGLASLYLPDLTDEHDSAAGYIVRDNWFLDNNRPNTARPGSMLSSVPSGTGILHVGADGARFLRNRIEGNDFVGLSIADYCLLVNDTPYNCASDDSVTDVFLASNEANDNQVRDNIIVDNGTNPNPAHPFAAFAADVALLTSAAQDNCFSGNSIETEISLLGELPACSAQP